MTKSNKRFVISHRKEAVVNTFKGISYVHLFDKVSGKSISFQSSEYHRFHEKHGDISSALKIIESKEEEKHKVIQKKNKKKKMSANEGGSRKRKTNDDYDEDIDDVSDDRSVNDSCDEDEVKKDVRRRKKIVRVKRCGNNVDNDDDSYDSED